VVLNALDHVNNIYALRQRVDVITTSNAQDHCYHDILPHLDEASRHSVIEETQQTNARLCADFIAATTGGGRLRQPVIDVNLMILRFQW
jgi:hypothetical protein